MKVKLRIANGKPQAATYIAPQQFPRRGDSFISPDDRAFSVLNVDWRYDLKEIHLFVEEFPRHKPSKEDPRQEKIPGT